MLSVSSVCEEPARSGESSAQFLPLDFSEMKRLTAARTGLIESGWLSVLPLKKHFASKTFRRLPMNTHQVAPADRRPFRSSILGLDALTFLMADAESATGAESLREAADEC